MEPEFQKEAYSVAIMACETRLICIRYIKGLIAIRLIHVSVKYRYGFRRKPFVFKTFYYGICIFTNVQFTKSKGSGAICRKSVAVYCLICV